PRPPPPLPSFPTRRSSDLQGADHDAGAGVVMDGVGLPGSDAADQVPLGAAADLHAAAGVVGDGVAVQEVAIAPDAVDEHANPAVDRKSTRLNSSHVSISYA